MRAAISLLTLCAVILTIFATVIFIQHEADRNAAINAPRTQTDTGATCPTDPTSPRYNPATAGRHVSALSEC